MREIKFKALDTETGKWDNDILTDGESIINLEYHDDGEFITTGYSFDDDSIIIQYIGEVDINDVEIYDGDIVKGPDGLSADDPAHNGGYEPVGVVTYENAGFTIKSEDTYWDHSSFIDWTEVEIIGNRFEDEDLIR